MSYWTHIRGSIELDVNGRTQAEIEYILKTVLEHLPRVQGSEGDMEVHIVKHDGHNSSTSCDEYGQRTNNLIDLLYGYKTNKNGWLQTQSNYTLTIIGDLCDRCLNEADPSFNINVRTDSAIYLEEIEELNPYGSAQNRQIDLCLRCFRKFKNMIRLYSDDFGGIRK